MAGSEDQRNARKKIEAGQMTYSSPAFLFFLAFALFGYWLCGPSTRKYAILIASAVWYGWWCPAWPLLAAVVCLIHFRIIRSGRGFWGLVAFDLALLVFLKLYSGWLLSPLGFGFILLSLLSYTVDFRRNPRLKLPESSSELFLFSTFFPLLMGGPVERYEDISIQLREPGPLRAENIVDGILIFSLGFLKKIFLADRLAEPMETFWTAQSSSIVGLSLAGLFFVFRFYLEFSSFCDMGRGAARCFGIRIRPNFRPIWFATDPSDYWRRWNITVGTWLRDYITFPTILQFGRVIPFPLLLIASFSFMGLWHGFSIPWLIFGIYNGLLIAIFVTAETRVLLKHPKFLRFFGLFLLLLLGAGNGVIQASEGLANLRSWSELQLSWPNPPDPNAFLAWLPLVGSLFLFELFQEKKGDLDFFLSLKFPLRILFALAFLGWFLFSIQEGSFTNQTPPSPLQYFRL